MAYEVNKNGKLEKMLTLPFRGFHQEIPPPPGVGGPRGDLPPRPTPKKD